MSFWKQRKVRRTVAAISITAMLMGMCVVPKFHISASTQKTGTITTEWIVETKKEPSPSAVKANGLEDGKKVTILEEVTGEDGKTWYQVAYVLKKDSSVIKAYVPAESVVIEEIVTYGKGIIYLKGGDLSEGGLLYKELENAAAKCRINKKTMTYCPIDMWFQDEFFKEKYVIYIPR